MNDINHPYHLALYHGLEKVFHFLKIQQQHLNKTHIVFECRGRKEDNELKQEFFNACRPNTHRGALPFDVVFANKLTNSCGLQIADLVAYPIGHHVLYPSQSNRAYPFIEKKLYRGQKGIFEDWGLVSIPSAIAETQKNNKKNVILTG